MHFSRFRHEYHTTEEATTSVAPPTMAAVPGTKSALILPKTYSFLSTTMMMLVTTMQRPMPSVTPITAAEMPKTRYFARISPVLKPMAFSAPTCFFCSSMMIAIVEKMTRDPITANIGTKNVAKPKID